MSENNHPCLYCAYPGPHSSINVDERTYFLCLACGAFFQILGENTYKGLTETVYSTGSWGETWQDSIKLHGPRLRSSLDWFHSNEALRPNAKYLDIGAGVGIVEHLMFEMFDTTSLDITAIEPVMENANFLQEKYPEINVIASDIEHITSPSDEDKFDVVICFGVDYLFRDLNKALRRVKDMVRNNGRILIVRAVFLDMPCYWGGGKPIRTFEDLVAPNPLITLFMFEDQYLELLGRNFKINARVTAEEKYNIPTIDKRVEGQFLLGSVDI